jgi:hypothetical protein
MNPKTGQRLKGDLDTLLLLLCNAQATNYRKNEAFKHCDHYSEWSKVANTVIEARLLMWLFDP